MQADTMVINGIMKKVFQNMKMLKKYLKKLMKQGILEIKMAKIEDLNKKQEKVKDIY